MNEILIKIGGFYHLLFLVFHLLFWKLFDWKKDLKSLTAINRAVMQVLNLRLIFVFLVFSFISLNNTEELLNSGLGFVLLIAIALFWFGRLIEQLIFFNIKNAKSIVLTILFMAGFLLYLIPAL